MINELDKTKIKSEIIASTYEATLSLFGPVGTLIGAVSAPLLCMLINWAETQRLISVSQGKNIGNIILNSNYDNFNELNITESWFFEFCDNAKNIDDIDLQNIWSKILTSKINKSNDISYRTLATLKNISKADASLFNDVLPYVFNSNHKMFYIPKCKWLDEKIRLNVIMQLSEAMLINNRNDIGLVLQIKPKEVRTLYNDKEAILLINKSQEDQTIKVEAYALTNVGSEIAKALDYECNKQIVYEVAKKHKQENSEKLSVQIYNIKSINLDGSVNIDYSKYYEIN